MSIRSINVSKRYRLIKFFVISAIVIGSSACTQTSEINTQEINQTQNNITVKNTSVKNTTVNKTKVGVEVNNKEEPSGWSNVPKTKHLKPKKCIGC